MVSNFGCNFPFSTHAGFHQRHSDHDMHGETQCCEQELRYRIAKLFHENLLSVSVWFCSVVVALLSLQIDARLQLAAGFVSN